MRKRKMQIYKNNDKDLLILEFTTFVWYFVELY